MIDLQKRSDYRIYVMLQLLTTFCGTKSPTKEQIKQYKGKRNELGDDGDDDDDDDDKSVYLNEDFAYKLIRYIDPGVAEANKFRKNLGVENNKSIWLEREIIAIIMKIFAKENMVRQYQVPGLLYRVDLHFLVHKLVREFDEDGIPYYNNDEIRQKLIEDHGFTFIRINPDPNPSVGFDLDVEITKIYNYINESSVKLAVNSAEKSLQKYYWVTCQTFLNH